MSSYNNDIIFIITDIIDNTCYLKGLNFRLCADSTISDLKKYTDEVKEDPMINIKEEAKEEA